jgi:hypothetical protein
VVDAETQSIALVAFKDGVVGKVGEQRFGVGCGDKDRARSLTDWQKDVADVGGIDAQRESTEMEQINDAEVVELDVTAQRRDPMHQITEAAVASLEGGERGKDKQPAVLCALQIRGREAVAVPPKRQCLVTIAWVSYETSRIVALRSWGLTPMT